MNGPGFGEAPCPVFLNTLVTRENTQQPWLPRLLHGPDCFTVSIDSLFRYCRSSIGITIIKIRCSHDCLIFVMGIPMLLGHLYIDGLVQERGKSSALAMELHLSCIYQSVLKWPSEISSTALTAQITDRCRKSQRPQPTQYLLWRTSTPALSACRLWLPNPPRRRCVRHAARMPGIIALACRWVPVISMA